MEKLQREVSRAQPQDPECQDPSESVARSRDPGSLDGDLKAMGMMSGLHGNRELRTLQQCSGRWGP